MCFSTLSTCSHLMVHILFNFNKFLKNIFFKSCNEDKANGSMRKCNFFIVTRMGKNQKMMALRMRVMMWTMNLANLRLDLSLLATWLRGLYVGSDWLGVWGRNFWQRWWETLGDSHCAWPNVHLLFLLAWERLAWKAFCFYSSWVEALVPMTVLLKFQPHVAPFKIIQATTYHINHHTWPESPS